MVGQPDTRYAKGPEGNIAYQVVGDGLIDLVIVPGWFSHLDMLWGTPGMEKLCRGLGIVCTGDFV